MFNRMYFDRGRRFSFCDRAAKILCCTRRAKSTRYTPDVTEYTSITTNDKTQVSSSQRRHSGTPFVKVMLSERDNQILLKHIRCSGSGESGSDKDPCGDNVEDAASVL